MAAEAACSHWPLGAAGAQAVLVQVEIRDGAV